MDYTAIIKELNQASLFDLYRLNVAINQQLNDRTKLNAIKKQLKVDQLIQYFDQSENRLIEARILELKVTKLLVENIHDGVHWTIPYYFVNLDNLDTDINATSQQKINKNHLKVGDNVCFQDKKGNELFGEVIKLNPKTAGVLVGQTQWRVAYSLLSPIISINVETDSNNNAIIIDI